MKQLLLTALTVMALNFCSGQGEYEKTGRKDTVAVQALLSRWDEEKVWTEKIYAVREEWAFNGYRLRGLNEPYWKVSHYLSPMKQPIKHTQVIIWQTKEIKQSYYPSP